MGDQKESRSSEDLIRQARERIESPATHDPEQAPDPETPVVEETQEDRLAEYVKQAERQASQERSEPESGEELEVFPRTESPVLTPPDLPEIGSSVPWYQLRWLRVIGGIAVGIGFAVFSGGADVDRNSSGEIVEPGSIATENVRVGDCLNDPGLAEEVSEFEAMPCGEPHDMEVFATPSHADVGAYPGETAVSDWGSEACYEVFEGYVGASWEASPDLDFSLYWPTEESWDAGDRMVICAVFRLDEASITGSLRDRGTTAERVSFGMTPVTNVAVGACYAYPPPGTEITEFEVLSCDGLHELEAYSTTRFPDAPGTPFPGDDALFEAGDSVCYVALNSYVGRPLEVEDDLTYFVLWPTSADWISDDRSLTCLAATASGKQMIGSVAAGA